MSTPLASPTRPRLAEEFARLNWQNAHQATIQMRYSDTDAMGHLNNAVYVQYLETSRILMTRDLQLPKDTDRSVVARLELDYQHEIKLGQTVMVETLIERLGNSSFTILSRILADGQPSAFARTVQVRVDEALRPTALKSELRAKLTGLLAQPNQSQPNQSQPNQSQPNQSQPNQEANL